MANAVKVIADQNHPIENTSVYILPLLLAGDNPLGTYPDEALITPENKTILDAYVSNGTLIWTVHYLQAAPINIYLVTK